METLTLKTLTLITAILTIIACSKQGVNISNAQREESSLTIKLNGTYTKAEGDHMTQANDNFVNTLEVFVFNADGENAGELDVYKKFNTTDGLMNLQMKTTTGNKFIYVVANSHRINWNGVIKLDQFRAIQASLKDDNLKDFIMIGSKEVTLNVISDVDISLSRLVAKVRLGSIRTAFNGTPYEGGVLSNVKAYLINVHSSKHIHNGEESTPAVLNNKTFNGADINSCKMTGMIYDDIVPKIGDSGYNNPHFFYAYENTVDTESDEAKFTRLVIQADLNGKTYYYPININRDGYGYVSSNGHYGVKRNTLYDINVTIMRPGSTNPDKPIEHGDLGVTINIENWVITPTVNQEF